ncbi:MAG: hypothetical protein D6B27_10140 [Gammaproteobacteria bacterium]|nr:MAG: hypothetical protein D6B27_10140 [Gammaproteobacteria bacterium]
MRSSNMKLWPNIEIQNYFPGRLTQDWMSWPLAFFGLKKMSKRAKKYKRRYTLIFLRDIFSVFEATHEKRHGRLFSGKN